MVYITQYSNITNSSSDEKYKKSIRNTIQALDTKFNNLYIGNKSYVPITSCLLEHLITNQNLSNHAKLFYLLTYSLSLINFHNKDQKSVALPASTFAKLLNCSRSQVFTIQKSLEEKGYLVITKNKNKDGQNKRNLLTPTLPDSVFESLAHSPNRINTEEQLPRIITPESKLQYLDKSKLFIPLNYQLLKIICSNNILSPLQKVIWLDFYIMCYKYHVASNKTLDFSFITSYRELTDRYNISNTTLSKAMNNLEDTSFIIKRRSFVKKDHGLEERLDKSLWKIFISLPDYYALELNKLKDRAGLALALNTSLKNNLPNTDDNKLNIVDIELNQHNIINTADTEDGEYINHTRNQDYIDDIIHELDSEANTEITVNSKIHSKVSPPDPHISKSSPYINKDLKSKTKEYKSNLRGKPRVLFNDFLKQLKKSSTEDKENNQKKKPIPKFNIQLELIRQKLKQLPKDKADKARKFAYSIISKKLAKGYASSLSKHELAKQLIHHASTWKPTKLGSISRNKQIDTALSVAWKAITNGTWQVPLELAKAEILQHEFNCYGRKYQESGIISNELPSLEPLVQRLLGVGYISLETEIRKYPKLAGVDDKNHQHSLANKSLALSATQDSYCSDHNNYNCNTSSYDNYISQDYKDHSKDIELPSYAEEQEYYLSKACDFDSNNICSSNALSDIDQNHNILPSPNTSLSVPAIVAGDHHTGNSQIPKVTTADLSHIPDQQKYLRMTASEKNDDMIIKTVNNGEYFFKLKSMESGSSEGEVVMTMQYAKLKAFIEDITDKINQ